MGWLTNVLCHGMTEEIHVAMNVFLDLMCVFQELEASEELDTICPKAPKLEER